MAAGGFEFWPTKSSVPTNGKYGVKIYSLLKKVYTKYFKEISKL